MATSHERHRLELELSRLEGLALYDDLTGLPNERLLARELEERLDAGVPFVLLHLDFDGMREANNSPLGYEAGGDFLIRTVGRAIPIFLHEEIAARLHRAGDEFACVLRPGSLGLERARPLEHALGQLELPETHRPFYGGASVGYAESGSDDTTDDPTRVAEFIFGCYEARSR